VTCSLQNISRVSLELGFIKAGGMIASQGGNGQWFIVSYDAANKQKHCKTSLHEANQPRVNIRANENAMAQ